MPKKHSKTSGVTLGTAPSYSAVRPAPALSGCDGRGSLENLDWQQTPQRPAENFDTGWKNDGSWKPDRPRGVRSVEAGVWEPRAFAKKCWKDGKTWPKGVNPPTGAGSSSMKPNSDGLKDSISRALSASSKPATFPGRRTSSVEEGTGERPGWPGGSIPKAGRVFDGLQKGLEWEMLPESVTHVAAFNEGCKWTGSSNACAS